MSACHDKADIQSLTNQVSLAAKPGVATATTSKFSKANLHLFLGYKFVLNGETMVPRGGIEPPTRGFSVRCSTN
jgi:hypothetical protein